MRPPAPSSQPHQYVAAETLDERNALARRMRRRDVFAHRPGRQSREDLLDEREALLDLVDADPDPRIHVAGVEARHLELEFVVRRITRCAARVERAT